MCGILKIILTKDWFSAGHKLKKEGVFSVKYKYGLFAFGLHDSDGGLNDLKIAFNTFEEIESYFKMEYQTPDYERDIKRHYNIEVVDFSNLERYRLWDNLNALEEIKRIIY